MTCTLFYRGMGLYTIRPLLTIIPLHQEVEKRETKTLVKRSKKNI